MHERLSFYAKRDSRLHALNPLSKLMLALGLTLLGFISPWYWTPQLIVLLAVIPLSFIGRVQREYFAVALRLILPATGFLFLMQSFFQPVGKDYIFHFWFLHITPESLAQA